MSIDISIMLGLKDEGDEDGFVEVHFLIAENGDQLTSESDDLLIGEEP